MQQQQKTPKEHQRETKQTKGKPPTKKAHNFVLKNMIKYFFFFAHRSIRDNIWFKNVRLSWQKWSGTSGQISVF